MDTHPAIRADGLKFLWDGRRYADPADAARAADSYRQDHFDVRVVPEAQAAGPAPLVYTRRVVRSAAALATSMNAP